MHPPLDLAPAARTIGWFTLGFGQAYALLYPAKSTAPKRVADLFSLLDLTPCWRVSIRAPCPDFERASTREVLPSVPPRWMRPAISQAPHVEGAHRRWRCAFNTKRVANHPSYGGLFDMVSSRVRSQTLIAFVVHHRILISRERGAHIRNKHTLQLAKSTWQKPRPRAHD